MYNILRTDPTEEATEGTNQPFYSRARAGSYRVVGVAAPPAERDLVFLHVELVDVRVEVLIVWVACGKNIEQPYTDQREGAA